MRAIGRRALIRGRAERLGEAGGLLQRIALDDFIAGDDHRPLRFQDARGQRLQRFVRRPDAGIDAGGAAELDAGLGIEDVAGQRDEHRPGRRRGRDLGGAAHDARQILQPRHLDRPFHQRFGHLHQRTIEHRLHQAVALLLLAGGEDHRRAGEGGVEQRAHRIAEARRDMDVAGDQPAGGAAIAVGDRDDEAFLHRHHIGQIGMILQRMHDRQLGGAGIAEQMRDALVLQQRKKGRAPRDAIFHAFPLLPAAVAVGVSHCGRSARSHAMERGDGCNAASLHGQSVHGQGHPRSRSCYKCRGAGIVTWLTTEGCRTRAHTAVRPLRRPSSC